MTNEMERITAAGLEALNLPAEKAPLLAEYGRRLLEANQVMNLTAITEPQQVARLHFLDCAALLKEADFSGRSVIDVGTGAGFPGLVLKTVEPSLSLTLLDSLGKRVDFLKETAEALGLTDVTCLHARAEEASQLPELRQQFDFAVSRAVAALPLLCELCLPYVKVGGFFLAMKGPDCAEELSSAASAVRLLGGTFRPTRTYGIPGTDVVHSVVVIEKTAPTPASYPRRWAKIQKAPL